MPQSEPNHGRESEWGHWGLTFIQRGPGGRDVLYTISFPVGSQGPMDGYIGSPERERYRALCRRWVHDGELPEGVERLRFGHSRWNGSEWEDCDCEAEFKQDCLIGDVEATA